MKLERIGWASLGLLAGWLCLFSWLYFSIEQRYARDSQAFLSRQVVIQTLALASLALSAECDASRNPTEGFCNSTFDVPGGYPYHNDCDVIICTIIPEEELFQIKIEKTRNKRE